MTGRNREIQKLREKKRERESAKANSLSWISQYMLE